MPARARAAERARIQRGLDRRSGGRSPRAHAAHPPICTHPAEYSPFYGIEKGAVLQESRCFHDPAIDPRRCQQVITKTISRYARLDVLVNNAGMMIERSLEGMSLSEWQQTLMVNLTAPFLLTKYAIPYLRVDGGSIVNVSSVAARTGSPFEYVDYAASKGAVDTMTAGLAWNETLVAYTDRNDFVRLFNSTGGVGFREPAYHVSGFVNRLGCPKPPYSASDT